jgi:hypothetical protein
MLQGQEDAASMGRCGGVICTLARHSWLWIRWLLVAATTAATTTIPMASSGSMPIVGSTMLLPSRVVGQGCLLL